MATIEASVAGGKWSATTAWEGGVVPGEGDDVVLGATSGAIEVVTTEATCRSLDASAFKKTLTLNAGIKIGTTTSNAAHFALKWGKEAKWGGTGNINFVSTSGTVEEIFSAGVAMKTLNFSFEGVGGKWKLAESLTLPTTCTFRQEEGTLNTAGHEVITGAFIISSVATATELEKSTIRCERTSSTTLTLAIVVTGTPNIIISGTGTEEKKISSSTANTTVKLVLLADAVRFTQSSTVGTLEVNTAGKSTVGTSVAEGAIITVTSFVSNATSESKIKLKSSVAGKPWKLVKTSGEVRVEGIELQDSHAEGGAVFKDAPGGVNVSGNEGWSFVSYKESETFKAEMPLTGTILKTFQIVKYLTANVSLLGKTGIHVVHTIRGELPIQGLISRKLSKIVKGSLSLGLFSFGPEFPSVSLLDTFLRNESVLNNGGKWAGQGTLVTGECEAENGYVWKESGIPFGAYWTPAIYTGCGVLVTLTQVGEGTLGTNYLSISGCGKNNESNQWEGYALVITPTVKSKTLLFKLIRNTPAETILAMSEVSGLEVGDKIGLSVIAGVIRAFHQPVSSGKLEVVASTNDTTFSSGFVGIGIEYVTNTDLSIKVKNFEAGEPTRLSIKRNVLNMAKQIAGKLELQGFRVFVRLLTGLLEASGRVNRNLVKQVVGKLSLEATRGKKLKVIRGLSGNLSMGVVLIRLVALRLTSALSFAYKLQNSILHKLTAKLSLAGVHSMSLKHQLQAFLPFTGFTNKSFKHALTALVYFSTSLLYHRILPIIVKLSMTGSVAKVFDIEKHLYAALSFVVAIPKRIHHPFFGKLSLVGSMRWRLRIILRASAPLVGSTVRSVRKQFSATLSTAPVLSRRILNYFLHGAVQLAGRSHRIVLKPMSARLSLAGSAIWRARIVFAAKLFLVGSMKQVVRKNFQVALRFSIKVRHNIKHQLAAALELITSYRKPVEPKLLDAVVLRYESMPNITLRVTERGVIYKLEDHLDDFPEMEFESIIRRRELDLDNAE